MDHPFLVLALSFAVLCVASLVGAWLRRKRGAIPDGWHEDLGLIISAALTLLGLLIGFSFSMAISRYDLRKGNEETEANAIGTEYLRADLLPPADAAKVQPLLRQYLDQRVLFYKARDKAVLNRLNADTARFQSELWQAVTPAARAAPTPVMALVISGMNNVLDSEGYTQAAYLNRIPVAAWGLMFAIAICCNVLAAYGLHRPANEFTLLMILPLLVSISFFLIAEIDSPRGGIIRVRPENLISVAQSLSSR